MKSIRTTLYAAACLVGLALILAPAPATADQVILDDLIVDGSLCVGFDCVNGESFGFDTIRLKENNLRIHFDDTSSSASFPTANWRIAINDTSNGGASFFAIEQDNGQRAFKIENGAGTNALVVDDGGRIGIGTGTPVVDVHIKTGNTPTLRLEQDGSSGFASQTWDVAGNEANFFVRDATNGSTLPLRIVPGAPSNAVYVAANGNVGLGTTSPDRRIDMVAPSQSEIGFRMENTAAPNEWQMRVNDDGRFIFNNPDNGGIEFELEPDGNLTIAGGLVTSTAGSCTTTTPCDGVFRTDEFTVESIDEHAAYMWENEHLRGVGPTPAGEPINLTRKTTGILHELEKAHIYIEQLHKRLAKLEAAAANVKD